MTKLPKNTGNAFCHVQLLIAELDSSHGDCGLQVEFRRVKSVARLQICDKSFLQVTTNDSRLLTVVLTNRTEASLDELKVGCERFALFENLKASFRKCCRAFSHQASIVYVATRRR